MRKLHRVCTVCVQCDFGIDNFDNDDDIVGNYDDENDIAGNYGASGMKAFLSMLSTAGICTAAELSIPQHVNIKTDPVFNTTVMELQSHENAR